MLNPREHRELAVEGARVQIRRFLQEFPELTAEFKAQSNRSIAVATPKKRTMSAAARREVSRRMKKYWAERRKAKASK